MILRLLIVTLLTLASLPAQAVLPGEELKDPVLETRARDLSKNIRCLVCQNQSIDESDADLARDLRALVRERLVSGDSDQEILDFLIARYGDFVMLKPPFKGATFLLWFGPAVVFAAALFGLFVFFRRRSVAATAPETFSSLNSDERDRLARLLDDQEKSS